MGYSGGKKENPTYRALGDHTETIEIDFDPAVISYGELLEFFWQAHDPTSQPWSAQYKSAVFYHDQEQKEAFQASKASWEEKRGIEIATELVAYEKFWLAEDYHQKYYLRHTKLIENEYEVIFPDLKDFVHSTAVTKANAYLAGLADPKDILANIEKLGLSNQAQLLLLQKNYKPSE